jgi:starch synthase
VSVDGLAHALRRTAALWADPVAWGRLQRNAMKAEVGWGGPAAAYAALYRGLVVTR